MITFMLVVPGLIAAYFLVFRSILKGIPALKTFYQEADGFWAKVWALCGRSITMVWSYFLTGLGFLMQYLEPIGAALGDPNIKSQVVSFFQANPETLGYVLMAISAITIATRLRSIGKG